MSTMGRLAVIPCLAIGLGCSQSTCDGVESAERAVLEARMAGAQRFLPEEFAALESALVHARREQDYQDGKVFWLQDREPAAKQLSRVKVEATRLTAEATLKQREARAAALEALERARHSIRETQTESKRLTPALSEEQTEEIGSRCLFLLDAIDHVERVIREGHDDTALVQTEVIADASRALALVMRAALSTLAQGSRTRRGGI